MRFTLVLTGLPMALTLLLAAVTARLLLLGWLVSPMPRLLLWAFFMAPPFMLGLASNGAGGAAMGMLPRDLGNLSGLQ